MLAVWLGTYELDCHACTPDLKVDFGCEEDSPIPGIWHLDDWEFQRCPLKVVTQQSAEYIRAYNLFKTGFLPNSGGWMEQSLKFLEAVEIIERELDRIQEKKIEEAKRKKTQ